MDHLLSTENQLDPSTLCIQRIWCVCTITHACTRLNRTDPNWSWWIEHDLCMINSPRCIFGPEQEKHKFVAESQYKKKNPLSTGGSVH